jgi:hypothetical protein
LLRFNQSKQRPVRNYLSRREQWRLLLLVMSLGVVIIAMRTLRRPETADHMARVFSDPVANTMSAADSNKPPKTGGSSYPQPLAPTELRRDALAAVRDNTYFRNAESDVWFRLIALLQTSSLDELNRASRGEVTYAQLVDQPRVYRAQLVTVRGTVRQLTEQTPAENDLGLKSYHRLVIQPSDGTQWPIFVYCLELPAGLSGSSAPAVDVSASGFFFKNLSYRWQDGLGIAPVILAKTVTMAASGPDSGAPAGASRAPVAQDSWLDTESSDTSQLPRSSSAREMLALAGWDAERFARFIDDRSINDDERSELLELLLRVRSFDAASIDGWSRSGANIPEAWDEPRAHKGNMLRLDGRVIALQRHELSARDAERLELPAYFTCEIALAGHPGTATVIASHVPNIWLESKTLNEPASASAVFVKRIALAEETTDGTANDDPTMLFVAKRIAWHPQTVDYPRTSLGKSLLGRLGVDVGLFDAVRSRGAIQAAEREPFYQILGAMARIDAGQLIRAAQGNLKPTRDRWEKELISSTPAARRALAHEVVRRADEGHYSVAPLFNAPEEHIGELAVYDGVARRVVRVDVGTRPDGQASDVAHRFGFREYYEMEIFTDDSQNYPLVFCVRELPPGFPTGGSLEVPVRVAGFFFKDWLYTTRGTRNEDARDVDASAPRSQFAPLLIGRGPVILQTATPDTQVTQWIFAGMFVLALAGVWTAAWWFARDHRKAAARARAANLSLPPGQSLNDLNILAANEPMNITGDSKFSPTNRQ